MNIAEGFKVQANFPNCLGGAVDGKHIQMFKPTHSASQYYNWKHCFSIVLMAIADANYRFLFIDAGSFGRASDSTIFANSEICQKMRNNTLDLPNPQSISENGVNLPFTFLGDEAFGLSKHMMRPYGGKNLNKKKKIYNYRHCRGRRYIECAFGLLTSKWRIFHTPINVKVETAELIVKACCTLHNFVRARDGYDYSDLFNSCERLEDLEQNVRGAGYDRPAMTNREKLADYFVSAAGALSWQENMIV